MQLYICMLLLSKIWAKYWTYSSRSGKRIVSKKNRWELNRPILIIKFAMFPLLILIANWVLIVLQLLCIHTCELVAQAILSWPSLPQLHPWSSVSPNVLWPPVLTSQPHAYIINPQSIVTTYTMPTYTYTIIITHLAEASWELVVISMANWTDFCSASRVLWSTGSTDWMSMLVMTRLLAGNSNLFRTFWFSSNPNTDVRIILAEFYKAKSQQIMQYTHITTCWI